MEERIYRIKLEEAERNYRELVENVNSVILRMDRLGNVLFLNKFGLEFFGFAQEEIAGRNVVGTIVPEIESSGRNLRQMIEDIPIYPERYANNLNENMRKNGERVWISWTNKPVCDTAGNVMEILCIGNDVTESKRIEKELRLNEERLRLAMEATKQGWFDLNIQTGAVVVSPEYPKILGYDPGELDVSLKSWIGGIHPEDRDLVLKVFNECISSNTTRTMEYRRKTKSGEWKWLLSIAKVVGFDSEHKPLRMIGTHTDISDRKQTEEDLASSKNYLSKIINTVADPIFVKDYKHRFVLINDAFCSFMGHSRSDLLGKSDYDFLPSEQSNVFWSKDDSVLETGIENINEELLTNSLGIVHTIVTKKTLYKDERGEQFIVGIIRDISEQKKVENSIQENYHFLQNLIDAIPNPIFYKDTNGAYLGFNRSYEQNFGVRRDNFVGSTAFDVFPKHLAQIYHDMDLALFESNREQIYESRAPFADGLEHDVVFYKAPYWSQDGNLAGLVGVVLDITKQKKIENDLQQAKTELEQTFDFLPDATFVIDREGRVIAWNKAIEQMTGIAKEDMLGKNNYEYAIPFYGERRPILIDLALKELREHEKNYQDIKISPDLVVAEAYVPNAYSGKGAYVSGRASPLYDIRGNLVGSIESVRDITERKKAEELMLKEERVRTLGVIASGVAHDINNQLTLLYGIPEMMMRSRSMQFVEQSFLTMIGRIKSAAETIQKTVARLQNFYRPSLDMEPLDINKVAAASVEITKLKWCNMVQKEGVKIEVSLDLEKDLPKIKGSETEIKQMFVNLILNAIDSISKQGQITIRTFLRNSKIVVEVIDTGSGMSEYVREKCLEPFFTTKGEGGSGIGLYSVRRSMSEHEGEMQIRSELGKGTAVSLIFPISNKNQKSTNEERQKKIPSLEILLIDDDKDVGDMMAEMLKDDGHRVIKASSGQEGLLKFSPESCDLVITDLGMPEMSGHEVVEKLRELSDIPIIVSSGFGDYLTEAEKSRLLGFGCIILSKPAKSVEIRSTIRKAMQI